MIILASNSPRRKEILDKLGVNFQVVAPSDFKEDFDSKLPPFQIVTDLSYGKARHILLNHEEDLIIAADTIVYFKGNILIKPKDREDAKRQLNLLFNNTCQIYSGQCIVSKNQGFSKVTVANVKFGNLDQSELDEYLDDSEADWMDKAGAFAIQGKAAKFTEVDGEWDGAVGLSSVFIKKYLPYFNQESGF
jgi:septum formation protein